MIILFLSNWFCQVFQTITSCNLGCMRSKFVVVLEKIMSYLLWKHGKEAPSQNYLLPQELVTKIESRGGLGEGNLGKNLIRARWGWLYGK